MLWLPGIRGRPDIIDQMLLAIPGSSDFLSHKVETARLRPRSRTNEGMRSQINSSSSVFPSLVAWACRAWDLEVGPWRRDVGAGPGPCAVLWVVLKLPKLQDCKRRLKLLHSTHLGPLLHGINIEPRRPVQDLLRAAGCQLWIDENRGGILEDVVRPQGLHRSGHERLRLATVAIREITEVHK